VTASVWVPEAEQQRYLTELASVGADSGIHGIHPVFFVRGSERCQFNVFVEQRAQDALMRTRKRAEITILPEGWSIQVNNNPPLRFDRIVIGFDIDELQFSIYVTSHRIAELILSGFGAADLIIFGDQIERLAIDPDTGEVKLTPDFP
jgi:hypothetical protein